MRALVTGATGFVGGHLIEHLAASGDPVVGISRRGRWDSEEPRLGKLARLEPLDLLALPHVDLVEFLRRKSPEVIYHLAAQSNPQQSVADPRATWHINTSGTLALLEATRVAVPEARVVLVGSGVCYGNPAPEHLPVNEDCPLLPNNPYAVSKAAADLLGIQHHLQYGAPVVVARPFNHAGPRQETRYVLPSLALQVAEVEAGLREAVDHGDLSVIRDFTDVRDIVRAYRLLALHGHPGLAYNIGTGRDLSLAVLLERLIGLAQTPIATRADPARMRAVDQRRLLADASRLREHTGWTPEIPIERTLADMLDEARASVRARQVTA